MTRSLRDKMRAVYGPRGAEDIATHLSASYGVEVSGTEPLDNGVFRVERADQEDWVARVFLPERGESRVRHDADLLRTLENEGLPAERLAAEEPVTLMGDRPVLVTRFIPGKNPGKSKRDLVAVADTLGRLLTLAPPSTDPGGSLHHVPGYEGLPSEDLRLAADLLDDLDPADVGKGREVFAALREVVEGADDLSDLPRGLIHPDPAAVNQILSADKTVQLIDWSGAGVGPRLYSIAQVLDQSATAKGHDRTKLAAAVAAFSAHVTLTEDEVTRLGAASRIRILWLAAWNLWVKVVRGKPLEGTEWWLLRAVHMPAGTAPEIVDAFQQ